ncbi:MAG: hypothetical protein QOJ09_1049 [Actinomycetota bacterium]|nr:hypothetical protein [Actinomycetota bacterium]
MIDTLLADWRSTAGDQTLFSASKVQALLFELWGETEGPARELVQEWLTTTLHRELYSTDELDELFGHLTLLVPAS